LIRVQKIRILSEIAILLLGDFFILYIDTRETGRMTAEELVVVLC
jgi:hypothetical protein